MNHFSFHIFLKLLYCVIIVFLLNNFIVAQNIEGYVFIDSNNNSIMDPDEKGVNGVMVSNQRDVILTDENGHFFLKLIEGNYIFVTKPEAYQFRLDMFNNPEFYFLYKTKDTKQELRYSSPKQINKIPEFLYFPVYKNTGEEDHSCLLIGDPQMKDDRRLGYYRDGVIPFMTTKEADFYIVMGDIANNYLGILPKEKNVTATLGIPGYRVFGNHDMNFKATKNKYVAETFKYVYGPEFYSFDYGSLHYIILNSVIYDGWLKDIRKAGIYSGGLTKKQLKWLINDLKLVPANKTIVLFSHIPLHEIFIIRNTMLTLFRALKNHKKIFAVSGHLHSIVAYDYITEDGWKNSLNFEGLVAGATCGSWWSGPLDENNIPYALCTDGSPKGFFQLNIQKEDYNYVFHSVNKPFDLQIRTYINNDEIWVNWFVGKSTDSVWVYLDDNPQAIKLRNFLSKDPLAVSNLNKRIQIESIDQTAHLWKAKLPDGLTPGNHSIKVIAIDSKGRLFNGFKTFYIDEIKAN
jgi:hypothetical protein